MRIMGKEPVTDEAKRQAARERAEDAAAWIVTHKPDLTYGATPKLSPIAGRSEQASLAAFESTYQGTAILIRSESLSELWWLDHGRREVSKQHFAIRPVHDGFATGIEHEIHFSKQQ